MEELRLLQLERLQATLNRVYKEVPFYRHLFDSLSFNPEDFSDLEDLKKLPFTTRKDLTENYPYNMFAVPLREVVRILATSGTTGNPLVVGYTRRDLAILAEISATALKNMGISKEDVLQITFHPGLFSSAFGVQSGAEIIGASVIPVYFEDPYKQLKILQDYRTTVLVCTPSYAIWLCQTLPRAEINPNSLFLKKIVLCGEPFTEAQRTLISETFKVEVFNLYSIIEVFGPGLAFECKERRGFHFQEDHFLVEVIDPETLDPVNPGETGELVITTLTKEAFPLIRYRTGDVVIYKKESCPCGFPYPLLTSSILGRRDDVVIIRGLKFYPSQIEEIITSVAGEPLKFQILLEKKEGIDEVSLYIVPGEKFFSDSFIEQENFKRQLEEKLYLHLNLPIRIKLVEESSLERRNDKILKIVDKR